MKDGHKSLMSQTSGWWWVTLEAITRAVDGQLPWRQLTGSCLMVDFDATLAHQGCVKGSNIGFQVCGIPHSSRLFLVRCIHFFTDLPLALRWNRGAEHSGEGTHEVGGLQCMWSCQCAFYCELTFILDTGMVFLACSHCGGHATTHHSPFPSLNHPS